MNCLENAVLYSEARWSEISSLPLHVIAGTVAQLQSFAGKMSRGTLRPPTSSVAVLAFTSAEQEPLNPTQRERLWRSFGVPVYELFIDKEAGVLASECETHEGWHVRHPQLRFELSSGKIIFQKHGLAASPVFTGLTASGLDGMCACGDESPLLRDVSLQQVKQRRARAAIA
jgi:phenylacetate-coenzyme A ligase PaaK-like adenylate-forming protein